MPRLLFLLSLCFFDEPLIQGEREEAKINRLNHWVPLQDLLVSSIIRIADPPIATAEPARSAASSAPVPSPESKGSDRE